jgi:hypothetical protein
LYSELFIPFLIQFGFFITIKIHTHTHTHTHTEAQRIRLYYTSRKVVGSGPFAMNKFSIKTILHSVQGPRVYSTCDRNKFQKQKINVAGE